MKHQLDISADLTLTHGGDTVTLQNDEKGNLLLHIPTQEVFREMTSYDLPLENGWLSSLKQWNATFHERGVTLVVKVEDKKLLTLGENEAPYINYLSLAGDYLKKLIGK